ncbi:MAG: CBS domain-containing protein [Micromonosporaceae bacterium]
MKTWYVSDVMTTDVAMVGEDTPYRQIVDVLAARRVSAVPVVDSFCRVLGVVSEADLMQRLEFDRAGRVRRLFASRRRRAARAKAQGKRARDLMTAPAVTTTPQATLAAAARLMDEENVKRLPVTDDLGQLVGIVTRGDLLKVYQRPDRHIRSDVTEDVLRRGLWLDPAAVDVEVDHGTVILDGRVETKSLAGLAVRLTAAVPGVVDVVDKLRYDFDDTALTASNAHRWRPFSAE